MKIHINQPWKLVSALFLSYSAGIAGSFFIAPAMNTWYVYLNKPVFTPPAWIFFPVWVVLYACISIAVWIVWRKGWYKKDVRSAVGLFFTHLVFNALWPFFFFGIKSPFAGLMGIVLLWGLIAVVTVRFMVFSKSAAWLMVPYLMWISFATVLNYSIWILNI